jgi:hypothetical protein
MNQKCKGCGAEILWAITRAGKHMPLDAKPEQRFLLITGIAPDWGYVAQPEKTYQSHFATCPKAAEFRK